MLLGNAGLDGHEVVRDVIGEKVRFLRRLDLFSFLDQPSVQGLGDARLQGLPRLLLRLGLAAQMLTRHGKAGYCPGWGQIADTVGPADLDRARLIIATELGTPVAGVPGRSPATCGETATGLVPLRPTQPNA